VQSKKFSDLLAMALSNYLKGMLTNEEVIEELLKMAEEIKKTEEQGNSLGLSQEEKAFYDALSSPEGIREAYTDEEFVALTKELTEQLRKNRTIDWNRKESSRAKMRVLVKRLLKKYKYPPEGQEKALEVVMAQCNKWADDDDNYYNNDEIDTAEVAKSRTAQVASSTRLIPPGSVLEDVNKDDEVRKLIHNMMELYEGTTILNIVVECQKEFQEKYFSMKPNEWRHLIGDYVREVTERPALSDNEVFRYSMAG
jgi:type I restriction enzyme R subunit